MSAETGPPAGDDECGVCERPRNEHGELNHVFVMAGTQGALRAKVEPKTGAQGGRVVPLTADIVLRKALVDAGLVTFEALMQAEAELRR